MFTINNLNDDQKEQFAELFYNKVNIDDRDSPLPWGLPWFFTTDFKAQGATIEELVNNYIKEAKSEIELWEKEEGANTND